MTLEDFNNIVDRFLSTSKIALRFCSFINVSFSLIIVIAETIPENKLLSFFVKPVFENKDNCIFDINAAFEIAVKSSVINVFTNCI